MKRQACMLLCAGLLALGAGALAQTATYVFPYEGFRYTQREDETVLTQTNLGEHEALLKSLGTSSEAVLASYVASGIVMEVIPDDGGQIAVSVTDAGKFVDVQDMDKMTQEQRLAFLAQFEMSGLYETCAYVDTAPAFAASGVKPVVHRGYDGGDIRFPDAPDLVRKLHKRGFPVRTLDRTPGVSPGSHFCVSVRTRSDNERFITVLRQIVAGS